MLTMIYKILGRAILLIVVLVVGFFLLRNIIGNPFGFLTDLFNSNVCRSQFGDRAFKDIGDGECYACPIGYERTILYPVTSNQACVESGFEQISQATMVGSSSCALAFPGSFFDPRNGGECWSCPAGYNRTWSAVTADDACSQSIFGPVARATLHGPGGMACPSGAFFDPINGGECWSCPSGYHRSLAPVTAENACARASAFKEAESFGPPE